MTVEDLPGCIVQYPACGCCGADTRNDGDGFYCEECGLFYLGLLDGVQGMTGRRWAYQGVEIRDRVAYHVWYCSGVGCYYWPRELYRIETLGRMVTA